MINGKQAINMPNEGEKVQFKNYHKQLEVPFIIYADFEAIVEKIHSAKQSEEKSYTDAYQKHKDCSYAYKVVCCYDNKYTKPLQLYRGENAVYKFLEKMLEKEKWCKETMKKHFKKQLEITAAEEKDFKNLIVVIFAVINMNHEMLKLETIAISPVNTEVFHIRNVI